MASLRRFTALTWIGPPALLALLAAPGCFEEAGTGTGKIVIPAQAYFTDKPGEIISRPGTGTPDPLVVQVLSAPIRGVPGRGGARDPVARTVVTFEVREEDFLEAANAPSLLKDPAATDDVKTVSVETDAHGYARAWVRLPKAFGTWRVRAGVRDELKDDRGVQFQVSSGIRIYQSGEENSVGRKVQLAVQVFKIAADRKVSPDNGRPVQFRVVEGPSQAGARLGGDRLADRRSPNSEGVTSVDLFLGSRSGNYSVIAEAWQVSEDEPALPAAVLNGIGVDWPRALLEVLAGVCLFLLGLRLLGSGILNLLGPAMALPVTDFARSRLRGFTGGVAAGAMFQSSTSVVSRLRSFTNGGLLTAAAALSVVLGANVGRTLLPQVLAFPLGPVGAVLLALGALALFLPRRAGVSAWGWALFGAGLVIASTWLFSTGVDILGLSPSLRARLAEWDYGAGGLSLGGRAWVFAATMGLSATAAFLLRSSNLLVVAAIILGSAGLLAPASALPVIVGANLGPAVSVYLTSVWARLEARRLAVLQLLFQVIGAAWLSLLCFDLGAGPPFLHFVEWLTPGVLFHPAPEQVGHHIAMAHTLYNLLNGLLCLGLAKPLLRLVERLLPHDPLRDDVKPYRLDQNLVEVPALALLQATREVGYLVELCRKAIAESFDAFRYRDLKLSDQTTRREESIDVVHRDVSHYLLRVGENDLSRLESSRLAVLQATTGNLVRIGELGERLRDLTTRQIDEGVELPEEVARDLNDVYDLVMGQFDNVMLLLEKPDGRTEENAVKVAERLARFGSRMEQSWFERLRSWEKNGASPPVLPDTATTARLASTEGAASAEAAAGGQGGAAGMLTRTLICRDALEALFNVAAHLSHIAERMRVLST